MDNLLLNWGFSLEVGKELKRCKISTIEVLLNFKREDLQFMNLHLPENIIERLFNCVDSENQETVASNANSSNSGRNIFENEFSEFEDNSKFVYTNTTENLKRKATSGSEADSSPSFDYSPSDLLNFPPNKKARLENSGVNVTENVLDDSRNENINKSNVDVSSCSRTLRTKKQTSKQHTATNIPLHPQASLQTSDPLQRVSTSSYSVDSATQMTSEFNNIHLRSFHAACRLNDRNVCVDALRFIITDSLEGLILLENYRKYEVLSPFERDVLTAIIINRCGPKIKRPAHTFFMKIAETIHDLMPNEDIDTYCVAPKCNGNLTRNAKGKLPDRWRNMSYKLNQADKRFEEILDEEEDQEEDPLEGSNLTEDQKAQKEWLKTNTTPMDEVKSHWSSTRVCRISDYKTKTFEQVFDRDWPILKTDLGPQLIDSDFYAVYPKTQLAVEKNWDKFFQTLYDIRKCIVKDIYAKSLIKIYENKKRSTDKLDGLQLLILPFLIPIKHCMNTEFGSMKVSYQESSDGFVLWVKDIAELSASLKLRAERYVNLKHTVQPVIVVIGKKPNKIEYFYVSVHDKLWEVQSATRALDLTFKLLMLMNLAYPKDCNHVWLTVQKCVYKITTEFDIYLPEANQAIKDLKVKLKQ